MNIRFNVISRFNALSALICLYCIAVAGPGPANACPFQKGITFPACDIAAPRFDERVSIVYAYSGAALSSVQLGAGSNITDIVDIIVERSQKPHYILLSSGKPVIWRFRGEIDQISRIVVTGSLLYGTEYGGVIGVPRDRIQFSTYDRADYAYLAEQVGKCSRKYYACEPSVYFDIPQPEDMRLAGGKPEQRYNVDQFSESLRAGTIWIGDENPQPKEGLRRVWKGIGNKIPSRVPFLEGNGPFSRSPYYITSHAYPRGIINIDPSTVVTPAKLKKYDIMPGQIGLDRLQASGALRTPDHPAYKSAYDRWDNTLSAPYRTELDPNFSFSYKVDYLVTRTIRLPEFLNGVAFLIANEAREPEGGSGSYCKFFADQRITGTKEYFVCDKSYGTRALPREQLAWRKILSSLEKIRALQREQTTPACRLTAIGRDTHFAGIAISEGIHRRYRRFDTSRRRIVIEIQRPGDVALYLANDGGFTDWQIQASSETNVTSVIMQNFDRKNGDGDTVRGVATATEVLNLQDYENQNGCQQYLPSPHTHRGGPAIMHTNIALKQSTGRELDSLIRDTNEGHWPLASSLPESPVLRYVIN